MTRDITTVLIIGGVFLLLGLIAFLWSRREEGTWYNSITDHVDVREFVDHTPGRPEPNALRIGGKISIAVGIVLLLFGAGFYIW
jgi:hypothetical protein